MPLPTSRWLSELGTIRRGCLKGRQRAHHLSTATKLTSHALRSDFLEDFIRSSKTSRESRSYFSSLEWACQILEHPHYEVVPFWSRHPVPNTGENQFFANTVNTTETIPRLVSLRLRSLALQTRVDHKKIEHEGAKVEELPEVMCLMSLGRDLQAHPSIVHGGFQCVILDEVTRFLILLRANQACHPGPRAQHLTLDMKVTFRAPVAAPSDVLVQSRLIERQKRSWLVRTDILSSEGKVLTTANSVWVTARSAT